MTQKSLYFAARKTITDTSDWGDDLSQYEQLTIYAITRGRVSQITEDSNSPNIDDECILVRFMAQNPGFNRRKERILYLITDCQLLRKLLGSTQTGITEDADNGNTTQISFSFDEIEINEREDSIDPSTFEGLMELCSRLGIEVIENIPNSILSKIRNLESPFKEEINCPDFSKLLED